MRTALLIVITMFLSVFIIGSYNLIYITLLSFNIIYLVFIVYYILSRERLLFLLIYVFFYGIFLSLMFFDRLGSFSILFIFPIFLLYLALNLKQSNNINILSIIIISLIFNALLLYFLYGNVVLHLLSIYLNIDILLLIISLIDGIIIYVINKIQLNNGAIKVDIS